MNSKSATSTKASIVNYEDDTRMNFELEIKVLDVSFMASDRRLYSRPSTIERRRPRLIEVKGHINHTSTSSNLTMYSFVP